MVIACHVVFSTYGFWLPNDPRGSNSDYVGAEDLKGFGFATKVTDKRSHARDPHNAALRAAAKRALHYPPVKFSGVQARSVANGFARCIERTRAAVYACAILPDHVHLVIARHRYEVEKLVGIFKADATKQLIADNLHPFQTHCGPGCPPPTCWGAGCRKVFLNAVDDVSDRIQYVRNNPLKEGNQSWKFVRPFGS